MDTQMSIPAVNGLHDEEGLNNLRVVKLEVVYKGFGLKRDELRVLQFPKLIWRKIYQIFSSNSLVEHDRVHTISIEGIPDLPESHCVAFACELRKQMDKHFGFTSKSEPRDYDHTFLVNLILQHISTNVLSRVRVTCWVTDDIIFATKVWDELIQYDTLEASNFLISSSTKELGIQSHPTIE